MADNENTSIGDAIDGWARDVFGRDIIGDREEQEANMARNFKSLTNSVLGEENTQNAAKFSNGLLDELGPLADVTIPSKRAEVVPSLISTVFTALRNFFGGGDTKGGAQVGERRWQAKNVSMGQIFKCN